MKSDCKNRDYLTWIGKEYIYSIQNNEKYNEKCSIRGYRRVGITMTVDRKERSNLSTITLLTQLGVVHSFMKTTF